MNKLIKSLLPETIKSPVINTLDWLISYREFLIDAWRYQKDSGSRDSDALRNKTGQNSEAQITKDYHRIEKGLSLRDPKRPFGGQVRDRLSALVEEGSSSLGQPHVEYAATAIEALDEWNELGTVNESVSPIFRTPAPTISRDDLKDFFASRRSVRNFDKSQCPPVELLQEAVALATNTPSVCNRQAARIHLFTDPAHVEELLRLQNGNTGFRETIPCIAIVSVQRGLFLGPSERNQRWIDGGLFAMTFVWALHGLGVSSCMLNWSMNNSMSDKLRLKAGIGSDEDVITLIAIGYPVAGHRIARSPRRKVSQVARIVSKD